MLYLASKSPRRRELLARLGLSPGLVDLDLPEVRQPGEPALDYVRRVAREKAGAGLLKVVSTPGALVLAADTEVVLDDEVFGKPRDADDARAMLARLSGRTHQVVSVVWVMDASREAQAISTTDVSFAALTPAQLDGYVASREWEGKAGAYAIQGLAEAFVTRIEGSYSGVMGLPVHETAALLADFGLDVFAGRGA
ncbi:nucleoside triphosphate pyrophosphatase [Lysobacter sp. N42]|jgi:septum formation protein|uniref:Maf family protein n=1 Tax=Lysobacter sp. N42 TaxID=2545719 RepID=UPI0010452F8A|nr:Maf family protein [Lysobacter sp. N42]TCZ89028.1 septum formation inhibitor Maf [Lysobacter sp. N42]